jgi:hypothetical protein
MPERPWHARWRLPAILAAAAAGVGLCPALARASDAAALVALEWSAPEGCPDTAEVEREVDRLLADASAAGRPFLRARAEVRHEKSGLWRVELQTTGPQGPGFRTVTAESCQALADATVLILALAIDPERVEANRSAPPRPSVLAPKPIPVTAPREAPRPRSIPPRAFRFSALASTMIDTGTLPTATPGFAARLTAIPRAFPSLRLELGAGVFLDDATTTPRARSGTFSLRTFDAGGCLVTPAGRLEIGACASVAVEWLSAAGLYESSTAHGGAAWWAFRGGATLAYPWSSTWAVRADVGAGLNLSRPEFVSAGVNQGLIHQPARYTGRGAVGVELRF